MISWTLISCSVCQLYSKLLARQGNCIKGHNGEQSGECIRAETYMEINIFINSTNYGKEELSENCSSLGHQITVQDVIRCFKFPKP